jgi:hypothetical protein
MDTSGGSKIVFPGEPESNTVVKFTPQVSNQRPKCADEYDFCESADNYPQLVVMLTFIPVYGIIEKMLELKEHNLIFIFLF